MQMDVLNVMLLFLILFIIISKMIINVTQEKEELNGIYLILNL